MKRVKGAYFSGLPWQRAKAHLYVDCGFITKNVVEAPLYSDGGEQLYVYTTLSVKGVPFGHKNDLGLGPRTVPIKQCQYCVRREERDNARHSRRSR